MKYFWKVDLHDRDGDTVEEAVYVFCGDNTILRFENATELETFANEILKSLPEIREHEGSR